MVDSDATPKHLDLIETLISHEKRPVTYKLLSRKLGVDVNFAKRMLYEYLDLFKTEKDKTKIDGRPYAVYYVHGETRDGDGSSLTSFLVPQEDLEVTTKRFKRCTVHLYGLEPCRPKSSDPLFLTDYEICRNDTIETTQKCRPVKYDDVKYQERSKEIPKSLLPQKPAAPLRKSMSAGAASSSSSEDKSKTKSSEAKDDTTSSGKAKGKGADGPGKISSFFARSASGGATVTASASSSSSTSTAAKKPTSTAKTQPSNQSSVGESSTTTKDESKAATAKKGSDGNKEEEEVVPESPAHTKGKEKGEADDDVIEIDAEAYEEAENNRQLNKKQSAKLKSMFDSDDEEKEPTMGNNKRKFIHADSDDDEAHQPDEKPDQAEASEDVDMKDDVDGESSLATGEGTMKERRRVRKRRRVMKKKTFKVGSYIRK
ncbi:DNA polymerase delta subunit 3 [Quaeritorhiza haematococci]|nr:DNA polymerase delta subunit 3 [Quaeritorhiza haematococci]